MIDAIPMRFPVGEALLEPPEVDVVIEVPKGSFLKRGSTGHIDFVSPLPCPFNYGSVPKYLGLEGDLLDAVVLGPRLPLGRLVASQGVGSGDPGRPRHDGRQVGLQPGPHKFQTATEGAAVFRLLCKMQIDAECSATPAWSKCVRRLVGGFAGAEPRAAERWCMARTIGHVLTQ